MSETNDAIDKTLLAELTSGAEKTFENAGALYKEARILNDFGAISRALFLHQVSLEECAKLEMLGAWATSLLMGHEVDSAKVKKAMASHAHKNRTNAYFLKGNAKEEAARKSGDVHGAVEFDYDTMLALSLMKNHPASDEQPLSNDEQPTHSGCYGAAQ